MVKMGNLSGWMKGRMVAVVGSLVGMFVIAALAQGARADPFVYVTNSFSGSATVVDAASNGVVDTVPVGIVPVSVAITPDGAFAYVANFNSNTVSVIDAPNNSVVRTVSVGDGPTSVAITPDGAFAYVANSRSNTVSVVDAANNSVVRTVSVGDGPTSVAITPDGAFAYVANRLSNTVSVVDAANNSVVRTVSVGDGPASVAITPDGAFAYVANSGSNTVSVIDAASNREVGTVSVGDAPVSVAITPDGAFAYIAKFFSNTVSIVDAANNSVVDNVLVGDAPLSVAITPDGAFAYVANSESNTVWVIDTTSRRVLDIVQVGNRPTSLAIGPLLEPTVPLATAILPSSRSVQLGRTATAFATVINGGSKPASKCRIVPPPGLSADFSFRQTDPMTNETISVANAPIFIPPGDSRTFTLSITPSATIAPTELSFGFTCDNAPVAAGISGVNTLMLSASSIPTADIIALAATNDPGAINVPLNGTGAFSVATSNQGATASITARVSPRPAVLPVNLGICQSDPTTGKCTADPAPMVTADVPSGATPTFAIFVGGRNQAIPFDPANNRVSVEFLDAGGVVRGSTSVAVRTVADVPRTLMVDILGSGSGFVTSEPSGIACPTDCSETFLSAAPIELKATSGPNSRFGGFQSSQETCRGENCSITLAADTSVQVSFKTGDQP